MARAALREHAGAHHLVDDFKNLAQARIAANRFPRPKPWSLAKLIAGKLFFFAWALALPLFFHRLWVVLIFYVATWYVVGVILGVVFQPAHCVDGATFPTLPARGEPLAEDWARHQVQSTVDFARRSRLLTWYLGGLNFQIEHHLFPKICHIHYPRIASIVERVCAEFKIRYVAHDRLMPALSAHWRWLRRMGRPIDAALTGGGLT